MLLQFIVMLYAATGHFIRHTCSTAHWHKYLLVYRFKHTDMFKNDKEIRFKGLLM